MVIRPRPGGDGRAPGASVTADIDGITADGPVQVVVSARQVRQARNQSCAFHVSRNTMLQRDRGWRVLGKPDGRPIAMQGVARGVRGGLLTVSRSRPTGT